MKHYDIIVVGAGAGGVFIAYELAKLDIDASVLIIDRGGRLEERICPIRRAPPEPASNVTPATS